MNTRLLGLCLALVMLLAFAWPGFRTLHSQQDVELWKLRVAPENNIAAEHLIDWDMDGRRELVLLLERGKGDEGSRLSDSGTKSLKVYEIEVSKGPTLKESESYGLSPRVSAVRVFVPREGHRPEVLCMSDKSCYLLPRGEGESKKTVYEAASFFAFPNVKQVVDFPLIEDLNGDGRKDILYPTTEGFQILEQQPGDGLAFQPGQLLPLRHPTELQSDWQTMLHYSSRLPLLRFIDVDNDGLRDLIAFPKRDVVLFLNKGDGRFEPWQDEGGDEHIDKDEIEINVFQILDIDGDGNNDMIASLIYGTLGALETLNTKIRIKYGSKDSLLLTAPYTESILRKGVSIIPRFHDVDGDGAREMLLSSVRTDLLSNALAAFTDDIDVYYYLLQFNREERQYDTTPVYEFKFKLELGDLDPEKTIPTMLLHKDVNADGLQDMVRYDHNGFLHIHYGSELMRYNKRPSMTFRIQPKGKENPDAVWLYLTDILENDGNEILVVDKEHQEVQLIIRRRQ